MWLICTRGCHTLRYEKRRRVRGDTLSILSLRSVSVVYPVHMHCFCYTAFIMHDGKTVQWKQRYTLDTKRLKSGRDITTCA